ncbi:MAG: mandelate racemase/muconate lactonizing enzyme family protein [Alphaproteobacteria bacterium]|nr:mandelate racemase/muconate lactonizing enzyme family protein [Alphaproteobacteria bacterium]
MRVDGLDLYLLSAPMPRPQGNSLGFFDRREALLVRMRSGPLAGWGEAWFAPRQAGRAISDILAPLLPGADLGRHAQLYERLRGALGFGDRGAGVAGLSAVDMAAWDLRARAEGVPIAVLLGGMVQEKLPTYASGPFLRPGDDPYAGFDREIDMYLQTGFRAVKLRMGHTPATDGAAAAGARRQLGPDRLLMADLNQGYRAPAALAVAQAVREAGLAWLEEPVAPEDNAGYRLLAEHAGMPIAGGEVLAGVEAFGRFIVEGRPAVVQPDLAICGGFTEAVKIAGLASGLGVALAPHVWGTAINLYASLQFAATLRPARWFGRATCPVFELDRSPNDLRTALPEPALDTDGAVAVPTGPGLGVEVRPEAFERFAMKRWSLNF